MLHQALDTGQRAKLGYVWTLESCAEAPWARPGARSCFPTSGFVSWIGEARPARPELHRRHLLVLWVDEDAIEQRPLHGMERIVERLALEVVPCASVGGNGWSAQDGKAQPARPGNYASGPASRSKPRAAAGRTIPAKCNSNSTIAEASDTLVRNAGHRPGHFRQASQARTPSWRKSSKSVTTADWLRFYSSGETAALDFQNGDRPMFSSRRPAAPPSP